MFFGHLKELLHIQKEMPGERAVCFTKCGLGGNETTGSRCSGSDLENQKVSHLFLAVLASRRTRKAKAGVAWFGHTAHLSRDFDQRNSNNVRTATRQAVMIWNHLCCPRCKKRPSERICPSSLFQPQEFAQRPSRANEPVGVKTYCNRLTSARSKVQVVHQ